MSTVSIAELKLAMDSLPNPIGAMDSSYTVFLTNPDRALLFNKAVRGDGWEEPWHNEWVIDNPPTPADPMSIMSDAEFDFGIDAMKDAEQQVLLNVAQTLLDEMEANTMRTVANWCDERAAKLEADAIEDDYNFDDEVGNAEAAAWTDSMFHALFTPMGEVEKLKEIDPTRERIEPIIGTNVEDDEPYDAGIIPTLQQLQDAADARGEPGPLDGIQEPVTQAEDFDLFEAVKAIRKAAQIFNAAVTDARHDGQVAVESSTRDDGTIWIDSIKLEMSL